MRRFSMTASGGMKIFVAVAVMFLLVGGAVGISTASPTLTFVNNSDVFLYLYVDGTARCGANAHSSCVTDIVPGTHRLGAVDSDGGTKVQRVAEIGPNGATWTVWK